LNDDKFWLAFSLIPDIGPKRLFRLYERFGDMAEAWNADQRSLEAVGLESKPLQNVLKYRRRIDPDAELEKVRRAGATLVTSIHSNYPTLLKELEDMPAVLYVRGRLIEADHQALAVVGTRKASKYGRDVAYSMSKQLAPQGVTIVSGLAQGIDSAAHAGALDGGGRTIAILGSGIDTVYPRENAKLAEKICVNGAVISEFPIGMQPMSMNFPRRNRLLSGLSLGVLVVEAPENSGALITATFAAEQGREVFAIPSSILSKSGRGSNRLIQDGAKLVMRVGDVLDELNIVRKHVETKVRTAQVVPSNETEKRVLDHLSAEPIHIDDLVRISGISVSEISSTLTILELKGLAQSVGHMQYSKVYR